MWITHCSRFYTSICFSTSSRSFPVSHSHDHWPVQFWWCEAQIMAPRAGYGAWHGGVCLRTHALGHGGVSEARDRERPAVEGRWAVRRITRQGEGCRGVRACRVGVAFLRCSSSSLLEMLADGEWWRGTSKQTPFPAAAWPYCIQKRVADSLMQSNLHITRKIKI